VCLKGPFSNLLLRFSSSGSGLLTRAELIASNFVAVGVMMSLTTGILFVFTRLPAFGAAAVLTLFLLFPVAAAFRHYDLPSWRPLRAMLVALAVMSGLSVLVSLVWPDLGIFGIVLVAIGVLVGQLMAIRLTRKYA
jgi:hypothetical protein